MQNTKTFLQQELNIAPTSTNGPGNVSSPQKLQAANKCNIFVNITQFDSLRRVGYVRSWETMHHICSLEIKVHYLNVTAFLCCFLFGPSLTSARNQIQMARARLHC